MSNISTNVVKTNSLKIHVMPKSVNDEYLANGLINENELYFVEDVFTYEEKAKNDNEEEQQ